MTEEYIHSTDSFHLAIPFFDTVKHYILCWPVRAQHLRNNLLICVYQQ